MSSYAVKSISYPPGVGGTGASITHQPHLDIHAESGSWWVRFFVDWPTMFPTEAQWNASTPDPTYFNFLCSQIEAAKQRGYVVILTLYRFPTWANPGADFTSDRAMADRYVSAGSPPKQVEFRIPDDLSVGSKWSIWLWWLAVNFHVNGSQRGANPNRWVDGIEFCNEPNGQMWPIMAYATGSDPYAPAGLIIHCGVAQMFQTARAIQDALGGLPWMMGPATADTYNLDDTTHRSRYDANNFTWNLKARLQSIGFQPTPNFMWTHHNYQDMSRQRWSSPSQNAAQQVRGHLAGWWTGWGSGGGDPQAPYIMLTEGGVERRNTRAAIYGVPPTGDFTSEANWEGHQWARLLTALQNLHSDNAFGRGIAVINQYQLTTEPYVENPPTFDNGILRADGQTSRPSRDVWRLY